MAGQGKARHGVARSVAQRGVNFYGMARLGKARPRAVVPGVVMHGEAVRGLAWQGVAGQGNVIQGTTKAPPTTGRALTVYHAPGSQFRSGERVRNMDKEIKRLLCRLDRLIKARATAASRGESTARLDLGIFLSTALLREVEHGERGL
jgi:hypothetical protein